MQFERFLKKLKTQEWKLDKIAAVAKKIWLVLFACFKIFAGAAATVLLICLVCGFSFLGILSGYLENDILPSANLVLESFDMEKPSYVYSVNEAGDIEVLQELYASTDWKKADYEDIPKWMIYSAIAIEDKRFFEHQGVDWFTTIKAFANMFFGDKTVGGSSITQQLIKNLTEDDSVTIQRKVLEFFRATIVEKNYDKKVIIEEYLNTIYLGQGCRGVRSAAEAYFGKELQSLTIAECASLISITNNPSIFNPYGTKEFMYAGEMMNGRERNRHRQLLVLGELLNQNYITREEYDEAVAQELVFKSGIAAEDKWVECSNADCGYEGIRKTYTVDGNSIKCPLCSAIPVEIADASQEVYSYFVDTVIQDVAKAMAKADGVTKWNDDIFEIYLDRINSGGYHIYTTIDTEVQKQVDEIYKNLENIPATKSPQQIQSAIVVLSNETGDIIAMAGGVGDEKAHFGQNRATKSKLQSGSSIKPLTIYAPGFEMGIITPATIIKDLPLQYMTKEEDGGIAGDGTQITIATKSPWPNNSDRKYSGSNTIFNGIVDSVNAIAAHTLNKIGINYGYSYATKSFGLTTLTDEDMQFSALALGAQNYGVTVREMAAAYGTFTNNGVYRNSRTWTKVYNSDGQVVLENPQQSREILSTKTINYLNYCLTNAVISGTGKKANFASGYVAGKTGTTSSARDKWFCGYTNYYTAAVWCGYDTPEKINLSTNPAITLWRKVMEPLHKGLPNVRLYDTSRMTTVTVCLDSGKLATDACRNDVRGSRTTNVMVYAEDRPTEYCDEHTTVQYCSGGGVATDYCKLHAATDTSITISNKGLLKMTSKDMDELFAAKDFGLDAKLMRDDYIFLIGADGKPGNFKGFYGDVNYGVNAPYKLCTAHTPQEIVVDQP
ncbi:MAG: transglycosylase domain-containing protein [Oscillospiraceae bacterium]|nr:transglycosylase domain-containing protein [Oscillospiraceae bacterium]